MTRKILQFYKITLLASFLVIILGSSIILPKKVAAADKMDDSCGIGISVAVSPKEVKTWGNVVTITTTVNRNHGFGYYCSTNDTVNFTVYFAATGANEAQSMRTGTFTIPADETGVGANVSKTDQFQVQFSLRGVKNQQAVGISADANVKRAAGEKVSNFKIETAQGAAVTLNSKTTLPQTNAPTNTGGAPTNNANSNNSNVNTGTSPDTGVTANVGDLDGNLGSLWNPLNFETVPQLIANLLRILFVLIGIAAVIIIIIAGFRMVLASGNEEELTKAKKAITWAIIGLIVSLMSFSIVAIIQRLIQVGA